MAFPLETDAGGQVYETGAGRAGNLSELRVYLLACRVKLGARIDARKLGVVERVISLRPEFQGCPFFEFERPEEAHVPVIGAGTVEGGAVRVADVTDRWFGNAARVEVLVERLLALRQF